MDPLAPLVLPPDDAERIEIGGVEHVFRLSARHGEGRLGIEEFVLPPGTTGARPHVHEAHDEYFYVLSGALTLHTGPGGELEAGPGGLVAALRGSVHGFRNAGADPVTGLVLYTPAGYEQFFRDVHEAVAGGEPLSDELMASLRPRHATRMWTADEA
ncbi:cupin domain [Motilibacter rhizosphaerae]|uniref:Cupin domain n=1 Tax=Motilibacter rhizosphaerae TaxID=598652 RepID=A0A4Q7NV20_9ACTN|nr:cupin domain-containing protein [Motilibacter rhizosphaerae]RZS90995.1 cupin domain [Motilibacter rhizosphaerae]